MKIRSFFVTFITKILRGYYLEKYLFKKQDQPAQPGENVHPKALRRASW